MSTSNQLFLIDAHALCYRSFYAIRDLTNSKGQMTNAVYGFVNTLRKILQTYKPTYMAVCFDSPKKTYREQRYADYKIQRPSMPDGLKDQIGIIKDIVNYFDLPVLENEGYEADDLIASLALEFASDKLNECIIVSDDKDLFQLAANNISFLNSKSETILDLTAVEKKLGISPQFMSDFLSLAGDSVDNIPGVKGIGKVTATKLINEFGSLEEIYENVDQVKPERIKEKLLIDKEQAFLSKELALLVTDVKVNCTLEDMRVGKPDRSKLHAAFKELEFRRFAEAYAPESEDQDGDSVEIPQLQFSKQENFDQFIRLVKSEKAVALFIHPESDDGEFYLASGNEVIKVKAERINVIKDIVADNNIEKIVYNFKEILHRINDKPETQIHNVFDVLLAGYLLSPVKSAHQISSLVWEYQKVSLPQHSDAYQHAHCLLALKPVIELEMEKRSLHRLYKELELPLSSVLFQMERHGVCLDLDLLKQLSDDCELKLKGLTQKLYGLAGEEFNINSPKQLSVILFERLQLPVIKRTKTGFSTDEGVLTTLSATHEFPALILEYRQLSKIKSTYLDALPKLVDRSTGRLHARFEQTGTETGRFSSRNPNLQNIPIRTDLGRQVRKAIVAPKGEWELIAADYSQIELRILAHLTEDPNLLNAFANNQDIHTFTASLIFDENEENVTREMRDTAKRVNFGIIYGMSAFGLSKDLGIPPKKAQEFIQRYFQRYPSVKGFMDETIKGCEEKGYVSTLLNRRRYLPEIQSTNTAVRQFAQRQAVNTPVQGSAADLMKVAMINVDKEMRKHTLRARLNITVHDELVFESPVEERDQLVDIIRKQMEHAMTLKTPIQVTIKHGLNWLEMKRISNQMATS